MEPEKRLKCLFSLPEFRALAAKGRRSPMIEKGIEQAPVFTTHMHLPSLSS